MAALGGSVSCKWGHSFSPSVRHCRHRNKNHAICLRRSGEWVSNFPKKYDDAAAAAAAATSSICFDCLPLAGREGTKMQTNGVYVVCIFIVSCPLKFMYLTTYNARVLFWKYERQKNPPVPCIFFTRSTFRPLKEQTLLLVFFRNRPGWRTDGRPAVRWMIVAKKNRSSLFLLLFRAHTHLRTYTQTTDHHVSRWS